MDNKAAVKIRRIQKQIDQERDGLAIKRVKMQAERLGVDGRDNIPLPHRLAL